MLGFLTNRKRRRDLWSILNLLWNFRYSFSNIFICVEAQNLQDYMLLWIVASISSSKKFFRTTETILQIIILHSKLRFLSISPPERCPSPHYWQIYIEQKLCTLMYDIILRYCMLKIWKFKQKVKQLWELHKNGVAYVKNISTHVICD